MVLAKKKGVTVSKDDTVIFDGARDKAFIEERCDQIRSAMESSTSDYDKEQLQQQQQQFLGPFAKTQRNEARLPCHRIGKLSCRR